MDTKEAKSQRLSLIAKWRNSGRRSSSRERSSASKALDDTDKKKLRKSSPGREYLATISLEPEKNVSRNPRRERSKSSAATSKVPTQHDEKENTSYCSSPKIQSEVENSSSSSPEPVNNNTDFSVSDIVNEAASSSIVVEKKSEDANEGKHEDLEEKPKIAAPVIDYNDASLPFRLGDIVWAYISGYPLWPAMVTCDPLENLFIKSQSNGKNELRKYHVEFFGDNGSRSWLFANALFPFKGGVEELLRDKDGFGKHVQTKSKIFKSLQQAIKSGRKNWQTALDEAKDYLTKEREERLAVFKQILQSKVEEHRKRKKRNSVTEEDERQPKRRRRQSKDSSNDDGLSVDSSSVNEVQDETSRCEAAPSETSEPADEQAEEAANNSEESSNSIEAKAALKKRDKEKKNPEMKIEVCESCGTRDGQLVACSKCRHFFHLECVCSDAEMPPAKEAFVCSTCDPSLEPICCLCKEGNGDLLACSIKNCSLRYHRECLKGFHTTCWKQERLYSQFSCPVHYCHSCVADLGELHPPEKKLVRCIECPTSYHAGERCLAAGCVMLSTSQMRCFKHVENRNAPKKSKKEKKSSLPTHYNVNWCLVCSEGGTLICCERCPAAFHTRCVGLEQEPDGSYLCCECTVGKPVLYGDIVWIKMSVYRWWPGRVYTLDEIPTQHQKYQPKVGEFLVYFYGSRNSAFVYRGQVFHYQDGDQGCKGKSKNKIGDDFKLALEEVSAAFQDRQLALADYKTERLSKIVLKPPPYNRIRTNKPIGKVRVREAGLNAQSRCECEESQERPCSSDTDCLNRMLQFECHPNTCPGKEKCENQRFQKRQSPRLYPFNTSGKGWGLKCSDPIKKGDFVIEYVGELIDHTEFRRRLKAKQDAHDEAFYFLTLDNNRMIDAGPSGNLARFMNHSCQPNCETQKWTVLGDIRVGLFAIEDIPPNTELTFNYHLECAHDVGDESQQRKQPCHCGAPNCGGFIGAKPKQIKAETNKLGKNKKDKKKRQRKPDKEKAAEDHCFRCYGGGHVVLCDLSTCPKVYHVECLNLSAPPKGKWTCPWHHCDVCGRKSTQFCSVCPNSLCSTHAAEANLTRHDELGTLCNEHSAEDIEFVMKRLAEEENDSRSNSSPEPSASLSESSNS